MRGMQIIFSFLFISATLVTTTTTKEEASIATENLKAYNTSWWTPQRKSRHESEMDIEGFSTKFSYSPNEVVYFKMNINRAYYHELRIYRLGYYGGIGATHYGNAEFLSVSQIQPNCSYEKKTRTVDCSNWKNSAQWKIPTNAVSGVYVAVASRNRMNNQNTNELSANYIPFIVRQSVSTLGSDILFKVSDLTWVAYNLYGGWNVYRGGGEFSFASRARKVSYNRPFANRLPEPFGKQQNFLFGTEFPALYWLEKQGYDVSYVSCSDLEELYLHNMLTVDRYRLLLSVGHDEYWTPEIRSAHLTARENGIHIAFLSGNEVFWRVVWEEFYNRGLSSRSPTRPIFQMKEGERRTVVCQKETIDGVMITNSTNLWTGTFIDPRFRPPEHQHSLTGQHFMVNAMRRDRMTVPRRDSRLRFWRDTSLSSARGRDSRQEANETVDGGGDVVYTSPPGLLGYEWDASIDDCHRPNGMFTLSHTTITVEKALMETYGASYKGSGTLVHKLSLYRHYPVGSGREQEQLYLLDAFRDGSICSNRSLSMAARLYKQQMSKNSSLVFGAGTVQWAWALSSMRDGELMAEDPVIQQATLNLFADMDLLPHGNSFSNNNVGAKLTYPSRSTDKEPPKSKILFPSRTHMKRLSVSNNGTLRIRGVATDFGGGNVAGVEVSLNGGRTWHAAVGRDSWSYLHKFSGPPSSLADTQDCSTFCSDGENAVSSYRRQLVEKNRLYDDYRNYNRSALDGSHGKMKLQLMIISRAVDDSGWLEPLHVLQGLCDLTQPRKNPSNIVTLPLYFK